MTPEEKILDIGLTLPNPAAPMANYLPSLRIKTGDTHLVFISGQAPRGSDGNMVTGKVGADLTTEEGYHAARLAGISMLAILRAEIGNLDNVRRVVKLLGMVNTPPDFTEQSQVINGCSDLMVEIFGDLGRHSRSAVGMNSLPSDIAVEIEGIFEVAV